MLMMHTPPQTSEWPFLQWRPEDWDAHMEYWRTLNADLAAAGEFVQVQALTEPGRARRVQAGSDGAPPVTDGPFPESKEFLAGYWIIDVDSAERAYQVAARASAAPGPGGAPMNMGIEVRQVMSAPLPDA
ncbi:MAG TPA: YciI family protein [Longimicrobium sp.]|jgi:hypothetical protein